MKVILLIIILTVIFEIYDADHKRNALFLISGMGYYIIFCLLSVPVICAVYFCLYLAYLTAYRDRIAQFDLINTVTTFYFIFGQIFIVLGIMADALAAALTLLMFAGSKKLRNLLLDLSADDADALAIGLGFLMVTVLTVFLQGVKTDAFIRFIFTMIELVLAFLLLFLAYLYSQRKKDMLNALKHQSIHVDSETDYLNKIQHDLRYAIAMQNKSGIALKKVADEIDEHLLQKSSGLNYLLKSKAAEYHKDLTLSASKNIPLDNEQIAEVMNFYEKVLKTAAGSIAVKAVSGDKYIKIVFKLNGSKIIKNRNAVYQKDQGFDIYTMILRRKI